jgi:hypothetical protein
MKIQHAGKVVATACALLSSVAFAAPLNLTDGDKIQLNWGYGTPNPFGGGAFTASSASVLNTGDSFLTFCLEYSEHISLGTSYFVDINTSAVKGGYSSLGHTPVIDPDGSATEDPLSKATAWLYTQFRTNTSALNRVSDSFIYDKSHANSMQLAIWKLEGELGADSSAVSAYNNDQRAKDWVSTAISSSAAWSGIGNVRVMNLYSSYTNGDFSGHMQDQLYLMPVPEPETYAMMLAGLGLIGFVANRRRRKPM